jgi:apolipoprotein N-acyltransferase
MTRRAAARGALLPLLLAALGALQTLALVHTQAWPLPLAAAALLAAVVARAAPARAALLGWAYGCGWLLGGTWWLFVSMHRYGHLPAPLAAGAVFLLSAVLSLYLAAAMAAFARWRRGTPLADAALFAAVWLLAELARGTLFTGFPWAASGYAQVDAPLAALAPWVGVYGIGAVGAFAAALAAASTRARWWPAPLAVALVLAPAALPPASFSAPAGPLAVTLLQANVPQDEKFTAERVPETLVWVATTLRQARGDLVVGPETVIPLLPSQLHDMAPGLWDELRNHFAAPGAPAALVGMPMGDFENGYTNSVVGLGAAEQPYRYDKQHLVPFGEFIPPGFRWFTEAMQIPLGDFARGPKVPPSFPVKGQRVAPNICYEDLFGEELALRFADAASAPTVFANVSNIGWFGDTVAVPQHLNISRMRSLEFERPMIRSTNTGATALVDHRGRVLAQLAPFTRGTLAGRVEGRQGTTPFAWWAARFGLWAPALLAFAVLAACALAPRRPGKAP